MDLESLANIVETEYVTNGRKSIKHLQLHLKHLRQRLGNPRAVEITTDRLRRLSADMLAEGYAAATINLHLATLQRAFTLATQARRLSHDAVPHFPYLRLRNARKGFFEREDLEAILAHVPEPHRAMFEVWYITGWRYEEILSRQWQHVDFEHGWLRLDPDETKNGEGRNFPLTLKLAGILRDQRLRTEIAERGHGRVIPWVFWHGRRGQRWAKVQHLWERARRAAGLEHRLIHDFRRTAVRNLELAGVPRSAAMAMVGLKTEAIFRRYAIVDEASLRAAAARLDARGDVLPIQKILPFEK